MYSFVYLASQSPRRAEILKQLGVRFEYLLPDVKEDTESLEIPLNNEMGLDYVQRVTLAKLNAAKERLKSRARPFAPILCADTTVCISKEGHDTILGKPENDTHALEILKQLNGSTHHVHTAVAICYDLDRQALLKISSSVVEFALCSEKRLRTYVETGEPRGKAGGYGIQGLGGALISNIKGSYSGIMGLPLFETAQLLDAAQVSYTLNM